ncbi:MAG TPA: hypothetical protein V6C72_02210 [Chroococcales cyanobacterium]
MRFIRTLAAATGLAGLLLVGSGPSSRVYADDTSQTGNPAPLTGRVSILDLPRLTRDDISATHGAQAGSASTGAFKGTMMSPKLDSDSTRLLRGFTDTPAAPVLRANLASNPDNAPYVWAQSGQGGYYDETGHCKDRVWGDHLREYGGKFSNGQPVPKGDVKVNAMGHIWWQPNLGATPGYFWQHK